MSFPFLNRCNGSRTPVIAFSEEACHIAKVFFESSKAEFRYLVLNDKLAGQYELGSRFGSFETVLRRIESAATEWEFLEQPDMWVMDALRDCASADHWYTYEKSYD